MRPDFKGVSLKIQITIAFTAIVSVLLIAFAFFIHLFSKETQENLFYERLAERATTTALLILEKDELDSVSFKRVEDVFSNGITGEVIQVYDRKHRRVFLEPRKDVQTINQEELDKIKKNSPMRYGFTGDYKYGLYYHDNQGDYVIVVQAPDIYGLLKVERMKTLLTIGVLVSVLITTTAGFFFARNLLTPLEHVLKDLDDVTEHSLNTRLAPPSKAIEFVHLISNVNALLARLENSFQAQKSFISNVSHEIRTPLSIILGELEIAAREKDERAKQKHLDSFLEEVKRLVRLSDQLLWLAHSSRDKQDIYFSTVRIDETIFEAVQSVLAGHYANRKVNVQYTSEPNDDSDVTIRGNSDLLKALFINLIENALKYSPEDKPVDIKIDTLDSQLKVIVEDKGLGVPKEESDQIFRPFFRGRKTKQQHNGYGIGLYLCRQIADVHEAQLAILKSSNIGTSICFSIRKHKDGTAIKINS
jgi:signal transduction histidine kinase